ncbi:GntR family transcriptional regulator [Virgibacillus profundi]|uniref:GntR family transcriptional regulator n=1 Tax=Virgibacillus profundi TaxID=2024555 RepID=A0A2A2IFA6_9BACI|nr:GntR family transcriptional regulator [Virgibacillus profundi]PAV29763.1 GntR family transcriptional regulator [Virgibacillus profundi]PXY53935.1 GntR family transcriptional regulator [Virgibacillus profundi]
MKTNTTIKSIERLSLREQIYRSLKTAIINMELKPGEKIRDQALAEQFNVSRTPVREALRRLEDEGLVVSTPSALTRVAELNIKEVKQAFVVVATLHGLAARLAVSRFKEKDFQLLKKLNHSFKQMLEEGNLVKAVEADDQFHQVFLQASENDEIIRALERITPKIRRLEFAKFDSLKGIDSVKEHEKIIALSELGDSRAVSVSVEENWLSLSNVLTE